MIYIVRHLVYELCIMQQPSQSPAGAGGAWAASSGVAARLPRSWRDSVGPIQPPGPGLAPLRRWWRLRFVRAVPGAGQAGTELSRAVPLAENNKQIGKTMN